MAKQVFRTDLLSRRQQLPAEEHQHRSQLAQQALTASAMFDDAASMALYSPTRGEVGTELIFGEARRRRKRVCYPRVDGERMVFVEVEGEDALRPGSFGILEPVGASRIAVAELDLMVLPGLAFDRRGVRLGYGKGFYDRELHSVGFSGVLVGLCFQFQVVDRLPGEQHDVPVDYLATEQGIFSPRYPEGERGSR